MHSITKAKTQEGTALAHGAQGDGHGVELDHDEPPDGQHQGVPDRYCVDKDGEVSMKQEEYSPVVRKLKRIYIF